MKYIVEAAAIVFGFGLLVYISDRHRSFATNSDTNTGRPIKSMTMDQMMKMLQQSMMRNMFMDKPMGPNQEEKQMLNFPREQVNRMKEAMMNLGFNPTTKETKKAMQNLMDDRKSEDLGILSEEGLREMEEEADPEILMQERIRSANNIAKMLGSSNPKERKAGEMMVKLTDVNFMNPPTNYCGTGCMCTNGVCTGRCANTGLRCSVGLLDQIRNGISIVGNDIETGLSRIAKGQNIFTGQPVLGVGMPFTLQAQPVTIPA